MQNVDTQGISLEELAESIAEAMGDISNMSLPTPELLTYYQLERRRKLWLDNIVDFNAIEIGRQILMYNIEDAGKPVEDRKPIWIYMMNYGGDLNCCWSLIDIITASETPVYTVDIGQCASAAALIFMAGHKRFMMPGSTILIHEGSAELSGDSTKVLDASDAYRCILKRMRDYILERTNIPSGTLSRKRNNDWELDSKKCMEYGVCDTVISKLSEVI